MEVAYIVIVGFVPLPENLVDNVKAYENGKEILVTYDSNTGVFESPSKPDIVKYDYVTGYKGVDMDVTLNAAYSPEVLGGVGNAKGGCNASFGGLALLSLVLLLRKRQRFSVLGDMPNLRHIP